MGKQKNKKKSKKKISSKTSTYRLFVDYLDIYKSPRENYNYYSDDWRGAANGLAKLKKRVLEGSCKGRIKIAMLYDNLNNKCLKVYVPVGGSSYKELSIEDYKDSLAKNKSLLKAFLVCNSIYQQELQKKGLRHPIIVNAPFGYNEKNGIAYFVKLIIKKYGEYLFKCNVYRQSDNKLIAKIDKYGLVTIQ